jgi:A/G-specific adenine glycosylase
MAIEIAQRYDGRIPDVEDDLKSLPGVGDYIAAAVRCFAFAHPEPLLDTNTVRILGRVFGVVVTDGSRRNKAFRELYKSVMDKVTPRDFGYALIDLGALLCLPGEPVCEMCPVNNLCKYGIAELTKRCLKRLQRFHGSCEQLCSG